MISFYNRNTIYSFSNTNEFINVVSILTKSNVDDIIKYINSYDVNIIIFRNDENYKIEGLIIGEYKMYNSLAFYIKYYYAQTNYISTLLFNSLQSLLNKSKVNKILSDKKINNIEFKNIKHIGDNGYMNNYFYVYQFNL